VPQLFSIADTPSDLPLTGESVKHYGAQVRVHSACCPLFLQAVKDAVADEFTVFGLTSFFLACGLTLQSEAFPWLA